MMAHSADRRGFVLLAAAEHDFEALREDVKALILERLDDVVVARQRIVGVNERGGIEEIVEAHGMGTSKLDGEPVEFAGHVVRSGDEGALVLGAWKDEQHAKLVAGILAGLHVEETAGEGGLVVTNNATGTSVTIPEGWNVLRNRKGLLATSPDRGGMAILMAWQKDFEKSLEKMRAVLTGWVFKEIAIDEFVAVEASYDEEQLVPILAARGTAIDRADDKPVQFSLLRIQQVDKNEGTALFGVWKDETHAEQVAALLASIRLAEPEPAEEE
jgi:hypothetical protein